MTRFKPLKRTTCMLMSVARPSADTVIRIVLTPLDAQRIHPYARGLVRSFVRFRMTKHEMMHAPPDVRKTLVRNGSMYEAELPCFQGLPLIEQLRGFLRGTATMGIALVATTSQLRDLVRSHPHLRDTLETVMTATLTETPATDGTKSTAAYLGLQPFIACPSPSPHAPELHRPISAAARTERTMAAEPDRGWISPCCVMPRQRAS